MIQQNLAALYHALELRDPELSLVLTDDSHIHALNREWMGEDCPTDVLSFPLHEPDEIDADIMALGDVVISLEYAERLVDSQDHQRRVAEELGADPAHFAWSLTHEVAFLLIHSLLHLVGYDHDDAQYEAEMKREERRLWESIAPALAAS
ncbi:MAG: rRNA maturation RNase YbeY [Bradymonadaceae bacterium]|nr:rRNA maturation RNase YbeY [Lujinxingiaceae bacterium]